VQWVAYKATPVKADRKSHLNRWLFLLQQNKEYTAEAQRRREKRLDVSSAAGATNNKKTLRLCASAVKNLLHI
jgi:hypothetical protein